MTITRVAVGETVRAAKQNELIDQANLSSGIGMIPTSVAGSGVSFDSTTGIVSFSAASAVTVNGCFTADFRNYEVEWDIPTTSTNNNLTFQLRASGSTAATGYDRLVIGGIGSSASPTTVNNLNQPSWQVAAATTAQHNSLLRLIRPFVAVATSGLLTGSGQTNPPTAASTFAIQLANLNHRTATAYDGFVLTASTGTITGTVTIRGIR